MKIKSIATGVFIGLSTTFLSITPALADDVNDLTAQTLQLADSGMPNGSLPTDSIQSSSMPGGSMPNGSMPNSPTDPLDTDGGMPDAPSGDDDY